MTKLINKFRNDLATRQSSIAFIKDAARKYAPLGNQVGIAFESSADGFLQVGSADASARYFEREITRCLGSFGQFTPGA